MGKYFNIDELTASNVAKKYKIDNTPNQKQINNLENLIKVLDVIREEYGKPITVNSGYRCPELNSNPEIKGSPTSWHKEGMAADIRCANNMVLWDIIVKLQKEGKIQFTELINEKPNSKGEPTWIHIAVNPSNLKNQIKLIK